VARSLTVNHQEQPSTSALLNVFLLLAFGWLALSAASAAFAESPAPPPTEAPPAP
jgi:hypothetical protein